MADVLVSINFPTPSLKSWSWDFIFKIKFRPRPRFQKKILLQFLIILCSPLIPIYNIFLNYKLHTWTVVPLT